jgi:RHS repeat-associated protein
MTASPGATYTNDVLGNRLTKGTTSHTWDILNRMLMHSKPTETATYSYRADGLRVKSVKASVSGGTTTPGDTVVYRYAGQMGTEDYEMNPGGSAKSLTRFGLGARGIDVVSRTTSSGSQVSYPLYDGHGNNVGSLLKNGASFTVADEKTYDAYGGLRSGGGADKGKYCASIGHKQDEESGLVYMRARYYEATSGRFVSEDQFKDKANWFIYCSNNPVGREDFGGTLDDETKAAKNLTSTIGALISLSTLLVRALTSSAMEIRVLAWAGLIFLASWFNIEMNSEIGQEHIFTRIKLGGIVMATTVFFVGGAIAAGLASAVSNNPAVKAADLYSTYAAIIGLFLSLEALETQ